MIEEIIKIAKKAGQLAKKEQLSLRVETKKDGSVVTSGDIAVSEFLIKKLEKYYPVLSEENYNKKNISLKKTFVVDPIDGTLSYLKKEDSWCILISLVEKNKPILSVIYQPSTNKIYYAEKGKGAYLRIGIITKKLNVSDNEYKRLVISPSENKIKTLNLIKHSFDISKIKSIDFQYGAGLKIMRIVENQNDLYLGFDKKCGIWDLMAPKLILEESGGFIYFEKGFKLDVKKWHVDSKFIVSNKKLNKKKMFTI